MSGKKQHGPERLRVYHLALEFADEVDRLLRSGKSSRSLALQLVRAVESVILNIAEGAAHFSAGQKLNHYRIAHGSVAECIGALSRFSRRNRMLDVNRARRTADMISVMLVSLIHNQERRRAGA